MKKRFLALLLAIMMLVSLLPAGAIDTAENDGNAIYRYNLHALQNGPWGSSGYAPSAITSIWQTTYGHSQNVASVYYESTLVTPPTDGGPGLGPYADQYTDPFCYVGMLKPADTNGSSMAWGDKAYGWAYSDPNQGGDGYAIKIMVPSSDTYTVETNIRVSYGRFADTVEVYIIPVGDFTLDEVLNVGNVNADIKAAGCYVGSATGVGGYSIASDSTNNNALQMINSDGVYLTAGEYYVCYRVGYRGFMGGSLTLRGTAAPIEGTLAADTAALNADGAVEIAPGKTVEVDLDASIIWGEGDVEIVDWEYANVSDARVDMLAEGVTGTYADGKLTLTAAADAEIGATNSATVYMVLEDATTAWCEIPTVVVAGETATLNLSHTGSLENMNVFDTENITLSAKIDGVETEILAEDTFAVEIVDAEGAASDIATAEITVNEDGTANLAVTATKAGDATVKITAIVDGAATVAAYEIPLHAEYSKLFYNIHRLQYGQWSGEGYFKPITYAADWGWENVLGNYYSYTTDPWIYYSSSLSEGSDISSVDKSTQNYGAKLMLKVGDMVSIKVRVTEAGNYDLLQTVQTVSSNMGASNNCGWFDIWFAPAGVENPTDAKYKKSQFRNYAPESTIAAQEKVFYSGTSPFAAVMSYDVADVAVGEGDYILTISPTSVNGDAATYTPTLYWSNATLQENGKEWIELGGGDHIITPNSTTTLAGGLDTANTYTVTTLSGGDVVSAEVDADGNLNVTTTGFGTGSFLVEAANDTASGAAIYNITSAYQVGLATSEGAQIRMREPQGLRFTSSISKAEVDFDEVEEFGTVLVPTAALTDISELQIGATVGGYEVAKVPAVLYRSEDENSITFSAVVIDILPANYKRSITARAYAIMKDGTVVYGDTYTARSPYEVAENGLASDTATDAEKQVFQYIIDAAQ